MISDVYRFILEVRPLLKTLDLTGCPCLTRGLARTYETIQQIALLREYLSILELINKLNYFKKLISIYYIIKKYIYK